METPAPCFGFSFSTATRWSAEARQDTRCGDRHEGEGPHARLLQPPAAPLARHLMVVGMASVAGVVAGDDDVFSLIQENGRDPGDHIS